MTTYFDAVLTDDMKPLCNGSPEEVLEWLEARPQFHDEIQVCIGRTMKFVTVQEYLEEFG
mgnify:CR=1 FL=1